MRRRSRTVLLALLMALLAGMVVLSTARQTRRVSPSSTSQANETTAKTPALTPNQPRQKDSPGVHAEPAETKEPTTRPEAPHETETVEPPDPIEWDRWVESDGFPYRRVRLARPDNANVFAPEELYLQNRVVLSQIAVSRDKERGMQISGRIFTDFIADKVPSKSNLPRGQLLGLRLVVALYATDCVLKHDLTTNSRRLPRLDPKDPGTLVPGQFVTVEVNASEGELGLAHFALPPLEKPLPPGVYRLVTTLRLQTQDRLLREALKWCSDVYGQRVLWEVNQATFEAEEEHIDVMANPWLHIETYAYLMQHISDLHSDATIYIGDTLKDKVVGLAPPGSELANVVIHDPHHLTADFVRDFEDQLDNVDEVINAELRAKRRVENADDALRRKWEQDAEDDKRRIRRDNADLITRYGGRLSADERDMLERNEDALKHVLDQIGEYQDRLVYQYWVLLDGLLTYAGMHSVNVPGYNMWEAVTRNDSTISRFRREQELREARESEGSGGKWERRAEQWKFYPAEIIAYAFDYLKTKEETDVWDAEYFVTTSSGAVRMDITHWRAHTLKLLDHWLDEVDDRLQRVTTTDKYAIQTWPDLLMNAMEAREYTVAFALSWECLVRVDVQDELESSVLEDWQDVPSGSEWLFTEERVKFGQMPPGRLKVQFEAECKDTKQQLNLSDFIVRWRVAIEAEERPPGLPD